ncbi:MAG: hypothetical protein HGA22_02570 [Clostridiales bacterium]|nr:hypothetical protein [Clostridiales bacterium]
MNSYNPRFETARRVAVLIFWIAALFSFMLEDTSMQLYIGAANMNALKLQMSEKPSEFYTYDEGDYVHDLTDNDRTAIKNMNMNEFAGFMAERHGFNFIEVQGDEWERFLGLFERVSENGDSYKDWKYRTDSNGRIYFKTCEQPVGSIKDRLVSGKNYLIVYGSDSTIEPAFLKVGSITPESSTLTFYGGLHHLTYPFSRYSLPLFILGLLIYILLPGPVRKANKNKKDNIVYLECWRMILHDCISWIAFFTFFSLPFFVAGGIKKVAFKPEYLAITLGFWLVFLQFGIRLLIWSVRHARFYIEMFDDRFVINQMYSREEFRLEEIDCIRDAVLVPPLWFGRIGGLLAPFRPLRYSGSLKLAGSIENRGIIIHSKDGRAYALWTSDTLGSGMYKNSGSFDRLLEKASAARVREPYIIRSLSCPARLPDGTDCLPPQYSSNPGPD